VYPLYKILFKSIGNKSKIFNPLAIDGYGNISIGNKVTIGKNAWLACLPLTNNNNCELIINDGSYIGNHSHIYATSKIEIQQNVLIADKVYISDNLHSYDDINTPIIKQSIKQVGEVCIGEGAWIGENVCIIGANVGKQSVIGANSVVTKNIPDYCVAVGSPAKVIKTYSFQQKCWIKVD
jgi:acetyltransferase-like isoleucine patch superfamily enzyme